MNTASLSLIPVRLTYHLPRRWYWHFCLWQGLRGLGFKVVRIIKLNHHHVWDLRLRAKVGDGPDEVRRLGREPQKLCALHGPPLKASEICTVRDGKFLESSFWWPRGQAGRFNWHGPIVNARDVHDN